MIDVNALIHSFDATKPTDVNEAYDAWGCNCGPTAIAAILGKSMAAVRHAFPWFPDRPRCSPTQLGEALATLQQPVCWTTLGMNRGPIEEQKERFPGQGLVVVQIDGPWCDLANKLAAYRYLHTVACQRVAGLLFVYDINAGPDESPGGWLPFPMWNHYVMAELVKDKKRATGWFVRSVFELPQPRLMVVPQPVIAALA